MRLGGWWTIFETGSLFTGHYQWPKTSACKNKWVDVKEATAVLGSSHRSTEVGKLQICLAHINAIGNLFTKISETPESLVGLLVVVELSQWQWSLGLTLRVRATFRLGAVKRIRPWKAAAGRIECQLLRLRTIFSPVPKGWLDSVLLTEGTLSLLHSRAAPLSAQQNYELWLDVKMLKYCEISLRMCTLLEHICITYIYI